MGFAFRPTTGLVFGLYLDGELCHYEQLHIDLALEQVPMLAASLAATYGIKNVEAYTKIIQDEIDLLTDRIKKNEALVVVEDLVAERKRVQQIKDDQARLKVLKATKKTVIKAPRNWRNLKANTKVHVLFKDTNWGTTPRFVGFFEGELSAPGFTRTAESRSTNIQAIHITGGLEVTSLDVVDSVGLVNNIISGDSTFNGTVATFDSTKGILAKFDPNDIVEKKGIAKADLDIYSWSKFSLDLFIEELKKSPIRNNYYARAIELYDMTNRVNDFNFDLATFTTSGTSSVLKWSDFYTNLLHYAFQNIMPALGGRISYMQMVMYVLEFVLHDMVIHSAPASSFSTVLVKPKNVFMPTPLCNVMFPLHCPNYNYIDSFRTKPTRHRMDMQPANGISTIVDKRLTVVVSPPQLREKIKTWESASDEERLKLDLITDEEYERGIIQSFNDTPAILNNLLTMISHTDKDGNVLENPRSVEGGGNGFESSENNTSTMSSGKETLDPAEQKAAAHKIYFHKELLILEGYAGKFEELTDAKLRGLNSPITGKYKFIPNRITIVPYQAPVSIKANYEIVAGKVTRKLGRQFHIFEEASGAIPWMFNIDVDDNDLQQINKQNIFLIQGSNGKHTPKLKPDHKKSDTADLTVHIKNMISYISGGFNQNLIILVDNHPASAKSLATLIALLSYLCEIKIETNVKTFSDYYGESYHTFNRDKEIRGIINTAINVKKIIGNKSVDIINKELAGIGKNAKLPLNNKIAQVLEANEAKGEAKYKISHDGTSYTLGGSQFNIKFRADAWEAVGFTKSEIDRMKTLGDKVAASSLGRGVETADEKRFIAGLDARLAISRTKVDEQDRKQQVALIRRAETWLRDFFVLDHIRFTSYSIIAHLADIANQFGPYSLTKGNSIDMYESGTGLITPASVLKWRLVNGSDVDQRRRHYNIEKIYNNKEKLSLTREQLISSSITGALTDGTSSGQVTSGQAESKTDLAVDSGTKDNFDANKIPSNLKIQDVRTYYAEPLCDYYFYENRYKSNSDSISIAFNPYLYPGHSSLMLDNSEQKSHMTSYLRGVSYTANAGGNLSCRAHLGFMRRADDLGVKNDLKLTGGLVKKENNVEGYADTVAELLNERLPFFGGKYEKDSIETTFDNTLGCGIVTEDIKSDENLALNDLPSVNNIIKRRMQYLKVVDAPEDIQKELDAVYRTNPSRLAMSWNGGDFPKKIHILKSPPTVIELTKATDLLTKEEDSSYRYIIDDKMFSDETKELVTVHNSIVEFKRAQNG